MRVKEISSSTNPDFKILSGLLQAKGIRKEGLCLVSGEKVLKDLLSHSTSHSLTSESPLSGQLLFTAKSQGLAEKWAEEFQVERGLLLSSELFLELDVARTKKPLYVSPVPLLPDFEKPKPGLNVFLALSDPSNLGACLRSLKAFSVSQVVLLKEASHPFLPKVTRSASGVNFQSPLAKGPSIGDLEILSGQDSFFHLDMEGESLEDFSWPETACLLLGEEGKGIPLTLKESSKGLKIPMSPDVESLSAPIAASLAAWEFYKQHRSKS
ncbi:MAG: hypothetical protein CL676_09225 [Bdellovibrionaceae bacterium]|nr:hypothetical protein [Pseudobdellovibrionaceae bacterium]|tara:strand:+ start:1215 stop:2018 length:804 start_codon:yes stop_codon:yes gene_type:complete